MRASSDLRRTTLADLRCGENGQRLRTASQRHVEILLVQLVGVEHNSVVELQALDEKGPRHKAAFQGSTVPRRAAIAHLPRNVIPSDVRHRHGKAQRLLHLAQQFRSVGLRSGQVLDGRGSSSLTAAGASSVATRRSASTACWFPAPFTADGNCPARNRSSAVLRCLPACVTHVFEKSMTLSRAAAPSHEPIALACARRSFDSISSIDEKLPPSMLATRCASLGHSANRDDRRVVDALAAGKDLCHVRRPRTSTGPL